MICGEVMNWFQVCYNFSRLLYRLPPVLSDPADLTYSFGELHSSSFVSRTWEDKCAADHDAPQLQWLVNMVNIYDN